MRSDAKTFHIPGSCYFKDLSIKSLIVGIIISKACQIFFGKKKKPYQWRWSFYSVRNKKAKKYVFVCFFFFTAVVPTD